MKSQRDRKSKKVGKKSVVPSFLTKLYQILENSEHHQIVKWADNGKAFVVKNLPEFIERVLPNYFKHNNFASFVRQLNMYDFHKTRNSNNENTFYHKMFTKGQKNLLKQIKRKVNLNRKNSLEDSEFSEFNNSREKKNSQKKNLQLEDIYMNMMKNLEEVSQKQKELEIKVELIERKNEDFVNENSHISSEITQKKAYTRNLETLIYYLFELIVKKRFVADRDESKKSLPSLVKKPSDMSLDCISANLEDEEKADLIRKVMENVNEKVLRAIIEKSAKIFDIKYEDINITVSKENRNTSLAHIIKELDESNTTQINSAINNTNTFKLIHPRRCHTSLDLHETSLSSPTSLLSTNDILTSHRKQSLLNLKRKRTDFEEYGAGDLGLNQKEKETIFDEITGLTPCLISSPNLSPKGKKTLPSILSLSKNEKFNYEGTNTSIFNSTHKNSVENFYPFTLEENINNIINVDDHGSKLQ